MNPERRIKEIWILSQKVGKRKNFRQDNRIFAGYKILFIKELYLMCFYKRQFNIKGKWFNLRVGNHKCYCL